MSLLEFAPTTTGNFIGQTSATDCSPRRRTCQSKRWICWAEVFQKKGYAARQSTCPRKKQRTCKVFWCFFTGFFGNISRYFCEFSELFNAFLRKSGHWHTIKGFCARPNGENTRHAHKFLPFVRRRGKKKWPNTGQIQGIAAPSTRCVCTVTSVLSRLRL